MWDSWILAVVLLFTFMDMSVNTMARLFNLREGFTRADDNLPQRMYEPLHNGKLEGVAIDKGEFEQMLSLYYDMAGWDENGVPTEGKLAELDLLWSQVKHTAWG